RGAVARCWALAGTAALMQATSIHPTQGRSRSNSCSHIVDRTSLLLHGMYGAGPGGYGVVLKLPIGFPACGFVWVSCRLSKTKYVGYTCMNTRLPVPKATDSSMRLPMLFHFSGDANVLNARTASRVGVPSL